MGFRSPNWLALFVWLALAGGLPGQTAEPAATMRVLPDLVSGNGPAYYGSPYYGYYPIRGQTWLEVDYLLWWVQGQNLPPLATAPGSGVVFGQERIDSDAVSGLRLRGGYYFDCDGVCGLMVDAWALSDDGSQLGVDSSRFGGLRMPFTDMDLSLPSNQVDGCGCLDDLTGTASSVPLDSISTSSSSDIWSGGLYYRGRFGSCFSCCTSACSCDGEVGRHGHRLDGICGYRYLALDESLRISGVLTPATGSIAASDTFRTDNDLHLVDLGLVHELDRGRWSWETIGRIGLGINAQELTIAGTGNQGGGIFAQYTNIGDYQHDAFVVLPELDLSLVYSITRRLRARIGYSFLWISNVVRPATQVDTRLDGRFFDATQPRPLNNPLAFFPWPQFETESVWLHGLTFGIEYSF